MVTAQRFVLATRPESEPTRDNFRLEFIEIPEPQPGQLLVRTQYLSVDPYVRGRISGIRSYAEPTAIGAPPPGHAVGVVEISQASDWSAGDIVVADTGWQTHALVSAADARKLDPVVAPVTTSLGVLGMPGFTAYAGLLKLGKPNPGDTVVVGAATGPVGSLVGQLAKIRGARAIGIAGGPQKTTFLLSDLGFDASADHKSKDFSHQLHDAARDGIDVYFENIGGTVFNTVFPLLNPFARIPVCGVMSEYNSTSARPGLPEQFLRTVLNKSLTIRGFVFTEFRDQLFDRFLTDVSRWIREGKVHYREDIVEGFENTPDAFCGLLRGENFGKLIVRIPD
ncbi:NADP-dependent oxidoreductase [Mycobacterium paraintracellulare]|uniref:NADP-dependent oxidoreductase n=1 Tax=Mycobacterium paraintracellulare TaxID=1138383 RepID=UPI001915D1E4|nr:NADP-dependent oxidoreductase [Mycobacterium paraintracellulare]